MGSSGWNKPSANQPTVKNGGAKAPNLGKGILAGLVVCVLALGVLYFLRDAEKPAAKKAEKKPTVIKEVTPAVAPTNAVPAKPKVNVEIRKLEDGRIMKYVNGKKAWMFPREDYHGPIHTTKVSHVETLAEKTFKNYADRHIASLLTIRPGSVVIGTPDYKRFFVEEFLKSYKDPFIIEPGDTPEQKELKKAVAEVKGDLMARHKAGEDIAQVMIDTRNELRNLAAFKREIDEQVRKFAFEKGTTSEELESFVQQTDKMLEGRGIKPNGIRGMLKRQLEIMRARESSNTKGENE